MNDSINPNALTQEVVSPSIFDDCCGNDFELRRSILKGATAVIASSSLNLHAQDEPAPKPLSSYSIPPVQLWDPHKDSFRPFFPIGWYSFGPSARIEELADNGANTALFAGMGIEGWHLGETLKRMEVAAKRGVKVVVGLRNPIVSQVRFGKPSTYGVIPQYVKALNKHPAMLGWQLGDEFSAEAGPFVSETVKLLRKLGSKHQTWQVHPHTWSHADVRKLMTRTDVCTFDGYTYLEGQPEFAHAASARVLAWQQAKADLIQTEGWAGNVNVTQAVGCKCGDIPFRFPTYREYRWNVFSALTTAGARGTMNWIYAYTGGFYHKDPKRFFEFRDKVVKPVNLEQRMIAKGMETGYRVGQLRSNLDELTSTTIPPATGPHRKYNKVGYLLLHDRSAKKYFLLVTNNEPQKQTVKILLSKLPAALSTLTVSVPHDHREVMLRHVASEYQLEDKFPAYGVGLYVLKSA